MYYKLYRQPSMRIISSPVKTEIEEFRNLKEFQNSLQTLRQEKKKTDN